MTPRGSCASRSGRYGRTSRIALRGSLAGQLLLAGGSTMAVAMEDGSRLASKATQNAVRPAVTVCSDGPWGAASGTRAVNQPIRP